jgi:hypothetical protein
MNKPNQAIIIGGGASIKEGISLGLWDMLKDRFVINCNLSFRHFLGTFMICVDGDGFIKRTVEMQALPLIFALDTHQGIEYPSNTILFKESLIYHERDSFTKGIYMQSLVGIPAIVTAIQLLQGIGYIFLLGYDWSKYTTDTHFYQDEHRGQGFTDYYEKHNPDKQLVPLLQETNIKIYNVSLQSNINCFEKISYPTMFNILDDVRYDQNELRKYINKLAKN